MMIPVTRTRPCEFCEYQMTLYVTLCSKKLGGDP
jgi:hypothetical protein